MRHLQRASNQERKRTTYIYAGWLSGKCLLRMHPLFKKYPQARKDSLQQNGEAHVHPKTVRNGKAGRRLLNTELSTNRRLLNTLLNTELRTHWRLPNTLPNTENRTNRRLPNTLPNSELALPTNWRLQNGELPTNWRLQNGELRTNWKRTSKHASKEKRTELSYVKQAYRKNLHLTRRLKIRHFANKYLQQRSS